MPSYWICDRKKGKHLVPAHCYDLGLGGSGGVMAFDTNAFEGG